MNELYSEKDYAAIHSQLHRRLLILGVLTLALLGLAIWSMVIRNQVLTLACVIGIGFSLIFGLEIFARPLRSYEKMLSGALCGRSHEETFEYSHLEPETSMVDGVACRSLVFLGEPDKHGTREQMYYWSKELPLPDLKAGDQVTLRYTGKMIIGYQVL